MYYFENISFSMYVGASGITSEVNELRQTLDRSLHNVSAASNNVDLASAAASRLLGEESVNLNRAVSKYASSARLTPSKLPASSGLRSAASYDNLTTRASTPGAARAKKNLAFDDAYRQ